MTENDIEIRFGVNAYNLFDENKSVLDSQIQDFLNSSLNVDILSGQFSQYKKIVKTMVERYIKNFEEELKVLRIEVKRYEALINGSLDNIKFKNLYESRKKDLEKRINIIEPQIDVLKNILDRL